MMLADQLKDGPSAGWVGGRVWALARPYPGPFSWRLRDAWAVLKGRAEAVCFIESDEDAIAWLAQQPCSDAPPMSSPGAGAK